MYSRLDVDATESEDDASEHGDPRSEIETSRPQCTSFRGVTAIIGRGAELLVVVVVVVVDVELLLTRLGHVYSMLTRDSVKSVTYHKSNHDSRHADWVQSMIKLYCQ